MKSIEQGGRLYIDVRGFERPEDLSYDVSRHLPRRMTIGTALVVADNPPVFLSVVRKRLAKLLYEIESCRARTLNRSKRDALGEEARRLRAYRFSAKPLGRSVRPDALFITPAQLTHPLPRYHTLYLAADVSAHQLRAALRFLDTGGLLVAYGVWTAEYEAAIANAVAVVS